MSDICIVGIGIHPFGRTEGMTGLDMGAAAIRSALSDAGVEWPAIQFAYGGSDASGNADTLVDRLGLTGLPFINVKNGCATGGSSLAASVNAIRSGEYDIGLAVGFDKHPRGAFDPMPAEWNLPEWYGEVGLMLTTQFFAMKLTRYMADHGISRQTLGLVAQKSFRNGALADHAWRREPVDIDTILNAQMVSDPLTKYMFCSPAEGAVSLILASEAKARQLGKPLIRLNAAVMRTRPRGSFEVFAPSIDLERGGSATQIASRDAFEKAGVGPQDIDVAQLQDTEVGAEIMHMAENGFCADGDQEQWLAEGRTNLNGILPVNTDGGCIACGEPIGASGLRQVAGDPKTAYSHVYGAPGVSAVTILTR
jgi:acetyl-CoA acetyltransferase